MTSSVSSGELKVSGSHANPLGSPSSLSRMIVTPTTRVENSTAGRWIGSTSHHLMNASKSKSPVVEAVAVAAAVDLVGAVAAMVVGKMGAKEVKLARLVTGTVRDVGI